MLYIGVLKRFVPFVITFAAGLFLASFFVSLAVPSFPRNERRHKRGHYQYRQMQVEYENLRLENERLKRELEVHRLESNHFELPSVPPVDLREVPPPPIRRRALQD